MALADPQTITISGVTTPLPRTFAEGYESNYTSADGLITLSVAHTGINSGKRTRSVVRVDHAKLTADPHKPAENVKVGSAVYTVFDIAPAGYTDAEMLAIWVGLNTQLQAASNAVASKILGGES